MNAFEFLDSFGEIQNRFIMEAKDMGKYQEQKSGRGRAKYLLIAAIVAVSLMIVTAFAAINYLGMREVTTGTPYEIPSEAEPFIETQGAQAASEDWSCTMLESLFDATTFTISVGFSGGDKYVVAPSYCSASDDVSEIGLPRGQTLGDYAAQQGKTLLFVGAGIQNRDELGIPVTTKLFKSQSDGEATIVETGQKSSSVSVTQGTCIATARIDGQTDTTRVELPFTVKEAAGDVLVYKAEGDNEVAGIRTNSFQVFQSPAGNSIVFDQEFNGEFPEELKQMDLDGIDYGEGGWVENENGQLEARWSQVKGSFGDTMTLRFISWDNEVMGTVTLTKQK